MINNSHKWKGTTRTHNHIETFCIVRCLNNHIETFCIVRCLNTVFRWYHKGMTISP